MNPFKKWRESESDAIEKRTDPSPAPNLSVIPDAENAPRPVSPWFSILPLIIDACLVLMVILTRVATASRYLQWWDSVQFALGLSDYDVTRHQPHPPGYPGYIALGWIVKQIVHDDNTALVIVCGISAAVIAIALHHLGRAMFSPRGGFFAGVLGALNPLLWYFSDVALSYILGTALATLAVWAGYSAKGRWKILIPILAGMTVVCWQPVAGIFIFPVCLFAYLGKWPGRKPLANKSSGPNLNKENPDDTYPSSSIGLAGQISAFTALFIIPILIGYIPVIIHTGGLGPYLGAIQSESGKHVHQVSQWLTAPLDEFIKNTGSLGDFFKRGLGIGRWLLLILLIPMPGERGPAPRRAIRLILLATAGILSIAYSQNAALEAAGIFVSAVAFAYLLPDPMTESGRIRRNILTWWIAGLLLLVPIYANFIGTMIIFLPGLIMLEAWAIDRAADFMGLQTVREPTKVVDNGVTIEKPGKKADIRVERLVAYTLIFLMATHEIGVFFEMKNPTQECFNGIVKTDQLVSGVVSGIHESPIAEKDILILGGEEDYRHWTYYLPEARSIWTKYVLHIEFHPGVTVWLSQHRHQDKVALGVTTDPASGQPRAEFPLTGEKAVFVRPKEMDQFARPDNPGIPPTGIIEITGKAQIKDVKPETLGFLVDTSGKTKVVFSQGKWWME
jgi:hypothetical protein